MCRRAGGRNKACIFFARLLLPLAMQKVLEMSKCSKTSWYSCNKITATWIQCTDTTYAKTVCVQESRRFWKKYIYCKIKDNTSLPIRIKIYNFWNLYYTWHYVGRSLLSYAECLLMLSNFLFFAGGLLIFKTIPRRLFLCLNCKGVKIDHPSGMGMFCLDRVVPTNEAFRSN